jgi:ubiquinone/menaquinone biosynthesis C-methylase UbiE
MFLHPDKNLAQFDLGEGMRVADFGAGSGHNTFAASIRVGHTGKVYAIEVQKNLLKRLENELKENHISNVSCIWGDIEKKGGTKITDRSMDRVILSNILFQVQDKFGLLDEAKRVLKPGGEILLIEWQDSFAGMGPQRKDIVNKQAALDLFEKRGFKMLRTISTGPHHYGIIFIHE